MIQYVIGKKKCKKGLGTHDSFFSDGLVPPRICKTLLRDVRLVVVEGGSFSM